MANTGGIVVGRSDRESMAALLARNGLDATVVALTSGVGDRYTLHDKLAQEWLPEFDTLALADRTRLSPCSGSTDLEREILLTLLGGPVEFSFPDVASLLSQIRVRCNIVNAARRTALNFDTEGIERPIADWNYHETTGFTVRPGRPLADALIAATQPGPTGRRYAFSCYRATEYIILLALAQEMADHNPSLLAALERQWQRRAIASRQFHDTFVHEYGTFDAPLPVRYYVPGDRLWFRNPHEPSSDVTGYEGSWVFYLGSGLFSNFWHPERPYTLAAKCLEIFHWRHGLLHEQSGAPYIDETLVEAHVAKSLRDSRETSAILEQMMRFRDPSGVYEHGGCIDRTREYPRSVCIGNEELVLPTNG